MSKNIQDQTWALSRIRVLRRLDCGTVMDPDHEQLRRRAGERKWLRIIYCWASAYEMTCSQSTLSSQEGVTEVRAKWRLDICLY